MNIENIALEKNITHMEAVLDYCQRNDIEPDTITNQFPFRISKHSKYVNGLNYLAY